MRRMVGAAVVLFAAVLLVPITASAANSPAQVVNCPPAPGCFTPNPISINVGGTVTWTNNGSVSHTSTSNTGAWDTGVIAPGTTSAAVTFNTAGTFAYHCAIHPSMTGTIVVSAAATAAPTSSPLRQLAPGGGGPRLPLALLMLVLGAVLLALGGRRLFRS
jgi:plastocyanin